MHLFLVAYCFYYKQLTLLHPLLQCFFFARSRRASLLFSGGAYLI